MDTLGARPHDGLSGPARGRTLARTDTLGSAIKGPAKARSQQHYPGLCALALVAAATLWRSERSEQGTLYMNLPVWGTSPLKASSFHSSRPGKTRIHTHQDPDKYVL